MSDRTKNTTTAKTPNRRRRNYDKFGRPKSKRQIRAQAKERRARRQRRAVRRRQP